MNARTFGPGGIVNHLPIHRPGSVALAAQGRGWWYLAIRQAREGAPVEVVAVNETTGEVVAMMAWRHTVAPPEDERVILTAVAVNMHAHGMDPMEATCGAVPLLRAFPGRNADRWVNLMDGTRVEDVDLLGPWEPVPSVMPRLKELEGVPPVPLTEFEFPHDEVADRRRLRGLFGG